MKPSEFNHIILPMRDELLGYALSVTRSEDNAEDLVQEVMLRLWDMRERLSSEGRLKSLAMIWSAICFWTSSAMKAIRRRCQTR